MLQSRDPDLLGPVIYSKGKDDYLGLDGAGGPLQDGSRMTKVGPWVAVQLQVLIPEGRASGQVRVTQDDVPLFYMQAPVLHLSEGIDVALRPADW